MCSRSCSAPTRESLRPSNWIESPTLLKHAYNATRSSFSLAFDRPASAQLPAGANDEPVRARIPARMLASAHLPIGRRSGKCRRHHADSRECQSKAECNNDVLHSARETFDQLFPRWAAAAFRLRASLRLVPTTSIFLRTNAPKISPNHCLLGIAMSLRGAIRYPRRQSPPAV